MLADYPEKLDAIFAKEGFAFDVLVPSDFPLHPHFISTESCASISRHGDEKWAVTVTSPVDAVPSMPKTLIRGVADDFSRSYAAICHFTGLAPDTHIVALKSTDVGYRQMLALDDLGIEVLYDGPGMFKGQDIVAENGGLIEYFSGSMPIYEGKIPPRAEDALQGIFDKKAWHDATISFSIRWESYGGDALLSPYGAWNEAADILSFGLLPGEKPEFSNPSVNPLDQFFRFSTKETRLYAHYAEHVEQVSRLCSLWSEALATKGLSIELANFTGENRGEIHALAVQLGIDELVRKHLTRTFGDEALAKTLEGVIAASTEWESRRMHRPHEAQKPSSPEYLFCCLPDKEDLRCCCENELSIRCLPSLEVPVDSRRVSARHDIGIVVLPKACDELDDKTDCAKKLLAALLVFGCIPDNVGALVFAAAKDLSHDFHKVVAQTPHVQLVYEESVAGEGVTWFPDLFTMSVLTPTPARAYASPFEMSLKAPLPEDVVRDLQTWANSALYHSLAQEFVYTAHIAAASLRDLDIMVEKMSYGNIFVERFDEPEDRPFATTCLDIKPEETVDDALEWSRKRELALGVAEIWQESLRRSGVSPKTGERFLSRGKTAELLTSLQETGRRIGVDYAIKSYLADDIPLAHVLGREPMQRRK